MRDAQQSPWGLMMTTDMITPVAEVMDKVGCVGIAMVESRAFTRSEISTGTRGKESGVWR